MRYFCLFLALTAPLFALTACETLFGGLGGMTNPIPAG